MKKFDKLTAIATIYHDMLWEFSTEIYAQLRSGCRKVSFSHWELSIVSDGESIETIRAFNKDTLEILEKPCESLDEYDFEDFISNVLITEIYQ